MMTTIGITMCCLRTMETITSNELMVSVGTTIVAGTITDIIPVMASTICIQVVSHLQSQSQRQKSKSISNIIFTGDQCYDK